MSYIDWMIGHVKKLIFSLLPSAVIFGAVLWLVGFQATVRALAEAGLAAFLMPGILLGALLAMQALAWAILGRPVRHRISPGTLFEAVTVGMAGNIVTPSTYLGGEPVRILYAGRKSGLPYRELAGSVLLAKYIEALSFVLFLGVATAAAAIGFHRTLFGGANRPAGAAVLVAIVAAVALFSVLWLSLRYKWMPLTFAMTGIGRLFLRPRISSYLRRRVLRMEGQASRVFRKEAPAVRRAFACYLVAHLTIFLKPLAFFFIGWRIRLGFSELSLFFLTCQVLLALQLTPSGVGTLDGGLLGMLRLCGISITAPQCAAFLLCLRFWDLLVVGVGLALSARVGLGLLTRLNGTAEAQQQAG